MHHLHKSIFQLLQLFLYQMTFLLQLLRMNCTTHCVLSVSIVFLLFKVTNLKYVHRLRVFENRVLRGIFGPKRDEVTGEWRKLHNEELRDLTLRQV
jgi:hypothetical protein